MKKIFFALVAALSVAACDPITFQNPFPSVQNPISASNLYEANLAYDGVLKAFNKMKSLCARRVIPSTCRTYVIKGQQVIPQAEQTRKIATSFIRQNPTLDASSLVRAFTTLIAALQANASQTP